MSGKGDETVQWLLFLSLAALFYALFSVLTEKRRALQARVATVRQGRHQERPKIRPPQPPLRQRLRLLLAKLANKLFVRGNTVWLAGVQIKLLQAGSPLASRPIEWIGVRLLIATVSFGLGLLLSAVIGGLRGLLLLFVLTVLGWIVPNVWLSRQARDRQQVIGKQLPSALDLLTISVEAGLGFDQALAKVAEKMEGPLAEEFARTIREIQVGGTRAEAMQRLGTRTGVDALKSFVSAIVQADKLGSGLAQVLRIQSSSLREIHRIDAQERAMKAPIKMMFPLVLFVFPSVFIVVLGPAVIHIITLFTKGGL